MSGPDAGYTNLYMKNLDLDITESLLHEKFSSFGKIISLAVAKNCNGISKGFGFVNFDKPDDAKRAMEAMNGLQLGSKILYVSRAQKKVEREQILHQQFEEKRKEQVLKYKGSNIYVKNIHDTVSDEGLRDHFCSCGTITSAKVMRDDKGISEGFDFVCFSTPEEANKAVNTFHEKLKLKNAEDYKYLKLSNSYSITDVNDVEDFRLAMEALDVVHISKEDQETVFAMLAAVLWLGNISFTVIDNEDHVQAVENERKNSGICFAYIGVTDKWTGKIG